MEYIIRYDFSLTLNKNYDVITNNNTNEKYEHFIHKLVFEEIIDINYYELHQICSLTSEYDKNEILINEITKKINLYNTLIFNDNETFNFSAYMQIWKSYEEIFKNLYRVFKIHDTSFLKLYKEKYNYLDYQKYHLFFNICSIVKIIENIYSNNRLNINITIYNVEEFLDFIYSINNIYEKRKYIKNVMFLLMHDENILQSVVFYINKIFKEENKKKIKKVIYLLMLYSNNDTFLRLYKVYLQMRLLRSSNNLELEKEIIKIIYRNKINKYKENILIKLVNNIEESKRLEKEIIKPYILNKNYWIIKNEIDDINIPKEIKEILDLIKIENYKIEWKLSMGYCIIEADLGKKVEITCNILQGMLLLYLNNNETIDKFKETKINPELINIILKSLYESNIIINYNGLIYKNKNFTGDNKIDIRENFIEEIE